VAVKDNILVEGTPTTCASKILAGYQSAYSATAVERLEAADAIVVGKTNLDEFAMGSSTENSGFGPTRNPWDLTRVPGGSSGGSAAAIAASMSLTALGSETGGSVRQPAALCGLVGLKPTYGAVSRWGLVAFASSLDQIGPMGRDAADCKAVFAAIAGHDPKDSTSLTGAAGADGRLPRRHGVPREYLETPGLEKSASEALERSLKLFEKSGFSLKEIRLPHTRFALPAYYILAPSEASANLARFDGMRYGLRRQGPDLAATYRLSRGEGFGPEVQRRILIGTFALSHGYYEAYYGKAQTARRRVSRDFEEAFREVDFIVTPTAPAPAFRLGEKTGDPVAMYLSDVFTIPANLAGLPAVSAPSGFSTEGLPVGLQIMGPRGSDWRILEMAELWERETNREFTRRPKKALTGGSQ